MKHFNPRLIQIRPWVDALLVPLGWWVRLRARKRRQQTTWEQPRHILVFDFHLLGDAVWLAPLLHALRQAQPQARLTLVAGDWMRTVLEGEGLVHEFVACAAPWVRYGQGWRGWWRLLDVLRQLRQQRWDWGIEVRGDVRQIALLSLARVQRRIGFAFGGGGALLHDVVPDDGTFKHITLHHQAIATHLHAWPLGATYLPRLHLSAAEQRDAAHIAPYVGVHVGASLPLRRLPPGEIDKLVVLAQRWGLPVVLFLPPELVAAQRKHLERLAQASAVQPVPVSLWSGDLRAFMVQLSRARHLYTMESGAAHLASALAVPVTVLVGPTDAEQVRPLGESVHVAYKPQLYCRPCDQYHCVHAVSQFCLLGLVEQLPPPPSHPPTTPPPVTVAVTQA